ncbi:MAG: porin [Zoogloeaceae bacterium]|nr:porin [Rhodocyclaceae bacterium]MCP5235442.1 porin [Zoogloeaceae bacterium]
MKKSICVLAIAGAFGNAAVAGDNVTLYGIVDIAVAYGKADGAKFTGVMRDGGLAGNRFGLKGSEDLGNGLSVVFALEQGYLPGSGGEHRAGRAFSRQSWAGLKGGFGTVSLGYQYAPGYLIPYNYQVMGGSAGFAPRSTLAFAGGYTISPGSGARFDNAIRYASPKFGGFDVQGIYAFHAVQSDDGSDPDRSDDDRYGIGATYEGGPVKAGLVYHSIGTGTGADDTQELFVGVSYDLGAVKLVGSWSRKDADGDTAADNTLFSVGAVMPVGQSGSAHLGFAKLNPRGDDNNGKSITAGYIQGLSKRTKMYAAINRLTYDDGVTYAGNPGAAVSVAVAGESANTVLAGIFHSF